MESFRDEIEATTSVIELLQLSKKLKQIYDPEEINAAVAEKRTRLLGVSEGKFKKLHKVYIIPQKDTSLSSSLDVKFKSTNGNVLKLSLNGHVEFV